VTHTGAPVGHADCISASPPGVETLAAQAKAYADVPLADMRGKGRDIDDHTEQLSALRPDDSKGNCRKPRRLNS